MEKNVMKKLGKITTALAVLILAISAAAALPTATNFGVRDATGNPNTFVEVPVNVTNVQNDSIASIIFAVRFDPNVLNLTRANVQRGSLTSEWDLPSFNPANGLVSIVYGGSGTEIPPGESGSVIMLNFSVVGAPGTSSAVNISNIQFGSLTGDVGTTTSMNGTFTVPSGNVTPTVTVTPNVTVTPKVTVTPNVTVTVPIPNVTVTVPPETRRVVEIIDNMTGVPLINQSTTDILAEDFINFNAGDRYNITVTSVSGGIVEYNASGVLMGGPKQTIRVNWTPRTQGAYILRSDANTTTEARIVQVINQKVISPIPELSTIALVSAGLLGLFGLARKRKNN